MIVTQNNSDGDHGVSHTLLTLLFNVL